MPPVVVDPAKLHEFVSFDSFYAWLRDNHDSADEVWIRIFRKSTGKPTISPTEAIDAVLCWGWIDAIKKSWDEESYVQRYTHRGRKSAWSDVNKANVARLIEQGLMTEHGLAHVELAKADGRWDASYRTTMEPPEDLLAAINASPAARALFPRLNAQNRFALIFRTINLKTPAGRARKIAQFVEMLERGETIYPQKFKP
jgi:Uncharacterized protein conserved in bacteria